MVVVQGTAAGRNTFNGVVGQLTMIIFARKCRYCS